MVTLYIIPPDIAGRPPESLGDQTRGNRLVQDQPPLVLRGAVRGHGKVMAMTRVTNVINDNYFGLQDVYCHHLEPPSHYWTSAHLLVCSFVLLETFS